jgi:membrane protein DedA with SNARE-associated domain
VTVIPVLAVSAATAPVSAALPSALNGLPTAAAVAVLCVAVIVEIVVVPAVLLPGGTVTLLAGALIGAGRPALAVAIPVIVAVVGADQLAFFGGAAVIGWWRRRRPEREEEREEQQRKRAARRGRAATWLTAAMPSIAGAARMPYRSFAARMAIMRVPWLAAALSAGTLAAKSLAEIGHVAGIIGLVASAVVVAGFFIARHRPDAIRAVVRTVASKRRLSTTLM